MFLAFFDIVGFVTLIALIWFYLPLLKWFREYLKELVAS